MRDGVRMTDLDSYLAPTWFIDSDHAAVRDRAVAATQGKTGEIDKAIALYYSVRDGIRYDPYLMSHERDRYRASVVAELPAAYCIQKAILLAAEARAVGIPARLGFGDVKNHLTTPKLRAIMGSDLFVFHGYTELHLEGRWVKATPAFNLELCERFGVLPLEFDGRTDSIFHPFDRESRRHMEYVRTRGTFAEFPYDEVMAAFREEYPTLFPSLGSTALRDDLFRPGPARES